MRSMNVVFLVCRTSSAMPTPTTITPSAATIQTPPGMPSRVAVAFVLPLLPLPPELLPPLPASTVTARPPSAR